MRNVKNKDLTPTPHGMQDAKWRPKSLGRLASLFALNASRDDQIDDRPNRPDRRNRSKKYRITVAWHQGSFLPGTKAPFIDHPLNQRDVGFGNGLFAYGYGQHDEYISEEERGRQQKMQGIEKYFSR